MQCSAGDTFYDRVRAGTVIDEATGCWISTGHRDDCGYGRVKRNGRLVRIHRSTFEDRNGPVPADLEVCHTCDNPACWNPQHLYAGTHQQNMDDRSARGRVVSYKGSQNGAAKLNEEKVAEIKRRLRGGEGCAALGRAFSVSDTNIRMIRNGEKWRHVA